ncbi:LRRC49 [Cordylochernes scorpioides]|uniref:Dynein axonemal assembly factor 1 homolog n=1 Tax=Cordylochernes scorpioides TaxID=51811 RepID=A0ABY6JYT2_9ARAC|nr:LRRC49 [Cordylochernes scorpioides]UYV61847.1 LRRC49 [Cordylochernes scorpioides]
MWQISQVQGLGHLGFLRVLNLSSNQVESVGEEMNGLVSLVELNLSRNQLQHLTELTPLPKLQRFFLGYNLIDSFESISCILKMPKLMELHLEGCPLSSRSNYRHFLLSHLVHLRFLDYRRVLDEEKRSAQSIMKKEEIKRQEELRMTRIKENKSKAIQNAREVWEGKKEAPAAGGELLDKPSLLSLPPEDYDEEEDNLCPFCEGTQPFCEFCSASHRGSTGELPKVWKKNLRKDSSKLLKCLKKSVCVGLPAVPRNVIVSERDVADPVLCHLADLDAAGTLSLYGGGSMGAVLDYPWHPQTLASVHCLAFHFIPFDRLAPQLTRLKAHFYNISHLWFTCCGISSLPHINALSPVACGLQTLHISEEGNLITELSFWKPYTVFRLPGLKLLNGQPVGSAELGAAEELFGGLANHTLLQLPKYRLAAMLNNPRVRQQVACEKGYSPLPQQRSSEVANPDLLIKAALTYTPQLAPPPLAVGFFGKSLGIISLFNILEC